MIEIRKLTKRYGTQTAVDRIELRLDRGIYALLGPNGAGKTTFLNMLMGAISPDGGEMLFDGASLAKDRRAFNARVGYLPQAPLFYKEFSGREFLDYVCVLKTVPKRERGEAIERALREVNLSGAAEKRIGAYSGGMRQRLGIAQALLGDPEILVFDEPTAGLDPIERIRFRNTISRMSAEKTVLIATHIVPDVESIAQTVILMKDGVILDEASPEALIEKVDGKVWQTSAAIDGADRYLDTHRISNIQLTGRRYTLRIVSDERPDERAESVPPRLEEAYIYLTGGNRDDAPEG